MTRKTWLSSSLAVAMIWLVSFMAQAQPAPDFSLHDGEGNTVTLSSFRGKGVVIHFWATWCPYCEKLQPGLQSLYEKYRDDGLEVLAISFSESRGAKPSSELKERGYEFITLENGDLVASIYNVPGTPTTFFIDRAGNIVWGTNLSDPNDPRLEKAVRKILGLGE